MAKKLAAVFLSVLCASVMAVGEGPANVLPNVSFEDGAASEPAGWRTAVWGGRGSFEFASIGRTGKRSVAISSENGADIGWTTTVPVRPFSMYRLSGWIKTENVSLKGGRGALFNLHNMQGIRTPAVTGTKDWTRVEIVFETGDEDALQVNCLFGGWGLATGKAWYDDVGLELLSTKELKPDVTVETEKTGEPISPYIYGQFIEHLGRCIYGGIWAEMLEDRKFWYAVGERASPWRAMGEKGTVVMVEEGSLVGKHTPEIRPDGSPCGIVHGGLGLVKGKAYVGRIVASATDGIDRVEVSLVWGPGPGDRETIRMDGFTRDYGKKPLRFIAGESTDDGRLEIAARSSEGAKEAWLRVGAVSLMPADNVRGMRADTLKLLKDLDAPVYRWPGGNFVSGYDWKDGIGDPDRRPPRKNPAWRGVEHNDFGIDEFIIFCRELATEPLVVVNSGLGDVTMAVEELEYTNGAPDTPMGKRRAENGHREPHRVRYWGVGNEMYGGWQLGHMPLEKYIKKHNLFAEAMRARDSSIKLVAVGAVGTWSEQMMTHCADHMDLVSEHFYCQERPGLLSHVRQIPNAVRRIAVAHRRYRETIDSLQGKDIRITLDEWNYWYGPHVYGELGVRYFLKDALGIAAGLHEYARQSDIMFMANYAQTVNVIGCIKTSKTQAAFATTGLALKMYRHRFGVLPVTVSGSPEPLDVAAAWTKDRKALTLGVVNSARSAMALRIRFTGTTLTGDGRFWRITGTDPKAYNEPGKEPQVKITEGRVEGLRDELEVEPLSATIYELPVR